MLTTASPCLYRKQRVAQRDSTMAMTLLATLTVTALPIRLNSCIIHAWLISEHPEVGQWDWSIKTGYVLIIARNFVLASQLLVMCSLFRLARWWWSSYNTHYITATPAVRYHSLTMHCPQLVGWCYVGYLYSDWRVQCSALFLAVECTKLIQSLISIWSK